MNKIIIALALTLTSFSSFASSPSNNYYVNSITKGQTITFKQCSNTGCSTLGNPDGYSRKDIDYNPSIRRIGNTVLLFGQAYGIGAAISIGAKLSLFLVGGSVTAVTAMNAGESRGPFDGFQKANTAAKLNKLKYTSIADGENLFFETNDLADFADAVLILEDVLSEM